MCWLNSCTVRTKDLAEERLSRPGSSLIPSGVVMRDLTTGEMVIVELGRVVTIPQVDTDEMLRPSPVIKESLITQPNPEIRA